MAKRVIDDSTLSPIADLVRSIMGLSDMLLLTPIDMASHLEDADGVVTNQEALIAELQELLEGKAGGGTGAAGENCTATITLASGSFYYAYFDESGALATAQTTWATSDATLTFQVAKNSVAAANINGGGAASVNGGVSVLRHGGMSSDSYYLLSMTSDGGFAKVTQEAEPE